MKKYFILLFLLFVAAGYQLYGTNIVIQNINEKYNLPKNRVNCMMQDSKGFLWFGMVNGLYKFDLNSFTKYDLQDNNYSGFPEVDVLDIIEAQPGKLIIGTNKGLYVFNTVTERYDTISCQASFPFSSLYIQCLYRQDNGIIWIGSDKGLLRIRDTEGGIQECEIIKHFDTTNTDLISQELLKIQESEGRIWFLTKADIAYYDETEDRIVSQVSYGANSSIMFTEPERIVQSLFGDGVRIFNTSTESYESLPLNDMLLGTQVRMGYKDRSNRIWLSISNVGLLLMDSISQQNNITLISNKNDEFSDLNSNVIYNLGESSDGAIWACTEEGISLIDVKPGIFNSLFLTSVRNPELAMGIRSVLDSKEGFVWIGSVGDGLFRFYRREGTIEQIPLTNNGNRIGRNVQAILKDSKNDLWLGTEGDGVIRLLFNNRPEGPPAEIVNYRIYPNSFPEQTLLNDYVMCLLEDSYNNIWIGTWYGLSLLESSEIAKADQSKAVIRTFTPDQNKASSISHIVIMSILEDDEGNILVGTHAGINMLVRSEIGYSFEYDFSDSDGNPLTNKRILDMHQDAGGDIWFSTQDGGICLLDLNTKTYQEFNSGNGFHDHIVNSISHDSLGILWLGTNNGLCRFDPETRSFNMYYTDDGLISNDFFYKSNCRVDDFLFFGGNKGLTWFDPYEITPDAIESNLVFTDFRLFNESVSINTKGSPLKEHISFSDELTLRYNQNYLTLEFAALNYRHQNAIHYVCMLEGLEEVWNSLYKEQKITYTNLNPGHYIFRVKAFTTGHKDSFAELSLPITIKPPFWRTILAYVLYGVVFILIIIYVYRYFLNQEKKKHTIALERINAKRMHEMDMMKLQFYTNISHELRTPLTLISAPLETLMDGSVKKAKIPSYYQMMHKNVQRLRRLITQLLDMRKIEEGLLKMEWSQGDLIDFARTIFMNFENYAERRNIGFSFKASDSQLITFFDADKLDKVLFNLLSNAFKYTPDEGSVSVEVTGPSTNGETDQGAENMYSEIKIKDSGIGIPEESLRNIFKPFHQVKKNKPIGAAGSGIGLSLAKELIELQGGSISVESEVDKGSVFTVKLPFLKEIPAEPGSESMKKAVDAENGEELNQNGEDTIPASKTLVLIVEDNEELRTFIRDELHKSYRILEASDGEEGLSVAIENVPDLIISDVMMDKMDGIEMSKKLKLDQRTSHIPVILLTARHSEEVKQNSYDIGVDDYITKPFNITLLQSRIKNLIEQRRKLRKLFGLSNNLDFSEIATNNADARFVEKMNQIIEKNIDNADFGPVNLASEMAMSKMQLYRKVSALTNQTVYNYIRTFRMNKAAQLLVISDMQIAEVAYAVGFTEASNFTKTFSQHFNQTPSQFVRENRK